MMRFPAMLASPMFGIAASGRPLPPISLSAASAAWMPAPWFAPAAATPSSESRSTASLAVRPESVSAPASKVVSMARMGREDTLRTASIAASSSSSSKNVSTEKKSTPRPSSTDACSAKISTRSAFGTRPVSPSGPIEPAMKTSRPAISRASRASLTAELLMSGELVLEEARGELAAVRPERVRLDHVRAGLDEADVELDDGLRRAQVRLLGDAHARGRARDEDAHAAVGDERRAGCEPFEEAVGHRRSLLPASGWETGLALCGHRAHLHRISAVAPHPRGPVAAASQGRVPQPLVMGEASLASGAEDSPHPHPGWGRAPPTTRCELNRSNCTGLGQKCIKCREKDPQPLSKDLE